MSQRNCLLRSRNPQPRPRKGPGNAPPVGHHNTRDNRVRKQAKRFVGLSLRTTARNVLGKVTDTILAKRLGSQGFPLASYLVPELAKRRNLVRDIWGGIPDLCRLRNEGVDSSKPWTSMEIPPCLRRLEERRGKILTKSQVSRLPALSWPGALKNETFARAWLSGVIAFNADDLPNAETLRYVGKMSNSSFCFVKRPTRQVVRSFISKALRNEVRYIHLCGPIRGSDLSLDPLFELLTFRELEWQKLPRKKRPKRNKSVPVAPWGDTDDEDSSVELAPYYMAPPIEQAGLSFSPFFSELAYGLCWGSAGQLD